jgi:hypothetical protein
VSALVTAPLLLALLALAWLGVQALWRRAFGFGDNEDVLSGRSCAACPQREHCRQTGGRE